MSVGRADGAGGGNLNLTGMLNVGPTTAARLRAVGIATPDDMKRLGAVEAFDRVEQAFPQATTLVLLYALEGALRGVPWTTLTERTKADLRYLVSG